MNRRLLSIMMTFVCCSLCIWGQPQVSSGENVFWHFIQFCNGGSVFSSAKNNVNISTAAMNGEDAQLWKFEGDNVKGYTITNKLGYVLCSDNANQNTMVKAATKPTSTHKYKIIKTKHSGFSGAFEIVPVGNMSVSMNLFGGPGANRGVGYWSNSNPDPNNCVKFVTEKEFQSIGKYAIIPYPRHLEVVKDGGLAIKSLKTICCTEAAMQKHLQDFVRQLKMVSGIELQVIQGEGSADQSIQMLVDRNLPEEGYTLKVTDHGVTIKASQFGGFFYALQTLKQILPNAYFGSQLNDQVAWEFPYLDITDEPNLEHRGFMLDVGRHFFDAEEVKRIIDMMALYKMNIFHWHLTEDQGWRIEIPEYPRLTEVGSIRKGSFSNPGEDEQFFDDTEYGRGMWYTQKELKEVVAYAAERNIDIVPEVDFPGHMVSAIAAYPELSCDPSKQYEVRVKSGVSRDVLNVGNDKVIEFLKTILDNLVQIFPYQYIHFGGDECPVDQWRNNADCLKRVKDNHLNGVEELQSWLIEELGTYVKEKYQKDIIVWDDFMNHWNANYKIKPVVMCWLGKNRLAAEKGLKSIACSTDYTYLDMMQVSEENAMIDEPYRGGWGGKVSTVEKIYNFNPYGNLQGKEEFAYGTQANMWTETTNDNYEMEYQVFPRLLAFAEVGWLPVSAKDWTSFYKRLQSHDEIMDEKGIVYAKHYIEPKELTVCEAAVAEAKDLLKNSIRGGVGYPAADIFDALQEAVKTAEADESALDALQNAIKVYKNAEIVLPVPGKLYQIYSASTYSKKQFAGSSLYPTSRGLRIHYTPQVEPEELWEFVPTEGGFFLQNVSSKLQVVLDNMNTAAYLSENGTAIRVDKATKATRNYTYLPGVVTLSGVKGYSADVTGNVKRLVAQLSGMVNVADDAALCYPGTWKMVEVTDFSLQLKGLCKKCEQIIRQSVPGKIGEPTAEALTYLKEEIIASALEDLKGQISEDKYMEYLSRYNQFLAMPRIDVVSALSEGLYYRIQNVQYPDYYALMRGRNVAVKHLENSSNAFLWQIVKNEDGSVQLINKAQGFYAYAKKSADRESVLLKRTNEEAAWYLELTESDQQKSGVAISDPSRSYSWNVFVSNGESFANVFLRTKNYTSSLWNFIETDEVVTGIDEIQENPVHEIYYDLSGRRVSEPVRGLYIKNNGQKVYVE